MLGAARPRENTMLHRIGSAALLSALVVTLTSQASEACGCFAPPDPTVPIVQAGERILFAVENGVVTAHIQIQYAGDAKDFGWLLPLPSVPTLKLGTEELFTQLINTTQPRYFVQTVVNGSCGDGNLFRLGATAFPTAAGASNESDSATPLVTQASIGPYDYAVLRADSKDEMLNWLTNNHFFIPAGTDETVGPYIHAGGFFLALKLKSGQSSGDIQPVVLTYPSDLPMIPIILTSVAAQPNMGVQVWMLGAGRAIPRNYNHVVLNDGLIDWLGQARNYNDVVIKAISETPEKHAFITEYAGTSSVMVDQLDPSGRFGETSALKTLTDPVAFVQYLFDHGFAPTTSGNTFPVARAPVFPPLTKNLLLAAIPIPKALTVSADDWLRSLGFYLGDYRTQHPEQFTGWSFDAPALAAQLDEKVVKPALEAGALFRKYPKLSRLYTTLSPEDMTRDPVFSLNPSLPDVSRDHTAKLQIECNMFTKFADAPRTLTTEQGWTFPLSSGAASQDLTRGPGSLRIETLAEEGAPQVLTDNAPAIRAKFASCGCSTVEPFMVGLAALIFAVRRRRLS
jgi:Uncharacterized protein conserved in bacteria (DUF2330)